MNQWDNLGICVKNTSRQKKNEEHMKLRFILYPKIMRNKEENKKFKNCAVRLKKFVEDKKELF